MSILKKKMFLNFCALNVICVECFLKTWKQNLFNLSSMKCSCQLLNFDVVQARVRKIQVAQVRKNSWKIDVKQTRFSSKYFFVENQSQFASQYWCRFFGHEEKENSEIEDETLELRRRGSLW